MSNQSFVAAMAPYAHQVASATGLDCRLFLVQWAYESAWGSSEVASHNNFAGIEHSAGKGCTVCDGIFTCCPSVADFAALYTAIIEQPIYASVRATAGQPLGDQFIALGRSPWAAGHYEGSCGSPGCALAQLYAANAATFDAAGCQSVPPPPPGPGPTDTAGLLVALLLGAASVAGVAWLYGRNRGQGPVVGGPGFARQRAATVTMYRGESGLSGHHGLVPNSRGRYFTTSRSNAESYVREYGGPDAPLVIKAVEVPEHVAIESLQLNRPLRFRDASLLDPELGLEAVLPRRYAERAVILAS